VVRKGTRRVGGGGGRGKEVEERKVAKEFQQRVPERMRVACSKLHATIPPLAYVPWRMHRRRARALGGRTD